MELNEKVKLAQNGDDNVFYELIDERKKTLYITAYTYVQNKDDALDIVHDTVLKAYTSIKKLKDPQFFNTWLTRILINCSIDFIRKNKKFVSMEETSIIQTTDQNFNEGSLDLLKAISKLNEKCKTVVILKYFQDMTLTEIAEMLNSPLGTIKSNLHKALKDLRIELREEGDLE